MEEADYQRLGLKCGIEIHQQLEGSKLFCQCETSIRDDDPHFAVQRQIRAVVGELGQVDIAAAQEMAKHKTFTYQGYVDSTCEIELDETPPRPLNTQALTAAIQVSKLMQASIVDSMQVMRKTVVDGSNTSGFQRTALLSRNGSITTQKGPIGIQTIVLEEDSCRIMGEEQAEVLYRLDRLGIPLIEIATDPDIHTPKQCKEVAEKIGMLLRSLDSVKRGLGTIRQDVNVSIKGGTRVEIKGAQDLKLLPTLVELEALRQKALLEITHELQKRKVKSIASAFKDVTALLSTSDSKVITNTLKKKGVVYAAKLTGFAGLIGKEVQPNKRLGTEFSERAKVIAGVGGIFHSDELPAYGITAIEVTKIKNTLGCSKDDAFFMVADSARRAEQAIAAVQARATQALSGVPQEVRKANDDGTTSYLRPMPGAARMYPETDIPPVTITKKLLAVKTPELLSEKEARYKKQGLGKDLAALLARSVHRDLIEQLIKSCTNVKPAFIAEFILSARKQAKAQHGIDITPTNEDFTVLFEMLNTDTISKEALLDILKEQKPVKEIIGNYQLMSTADLEKELKRIITANKKAPFNALMGEAMKQLKGKADGKKIAALLKKLAQ